MQLLNLFVILLVPGNAAVLHKALDLGKLGYPTDCLYFAELSQLVALREGRLLNERTVAFLTRKCNLIEVDVKTVIEVLKQKVTAVAHRIRRYDNRCLQYRQN